MVKVSADQKQSFTTTRGMGKHCELNRTASVFKFFFRGDKKKKKKKKFHLNSPEKVNGHDVVVFYRESESLIKSWSTWAQRKEKRGHFVTLT